LKTNNNNSNFTTCPNCKGQGKKSQRIRKKAKLDYQRELIAFKKNKEKDRAPNQPKGHLVTCSHCHGAGIVSSTYPSVPDEENYPHIAIIGGGIGGVALAVACLHRGIPFTLYERDSSFDARSQGYGLTLQQASKAMEGFGLFSLKEGLVSTKHIVHTTNGTVVGEWGIRKWLKSEENTYAKRTNIHIARQSLRLALLDQLGGHNMVQWEHQFINFKENEGDALELTFDVNGHIKTTKADLVVGADGIRSSIRKLVIDDVVSPLRYLDCMVILGICPLERLQGLEHALLDSATVFQTANGQERIYMMPYDSKSIMWQLSFPILERDAKKLSAKGAPALKEEACHRTQWHDPIPQIMAATSADQVSGYPVYDRDFLDPVALKKAAQITLIGDAAHPMSPFKGQGANQALLDALALARSIAKGCRPQTNWKGTGIRESVLNKFEAEMIDRTTSKVRDSAAAAQFLHSDIALHKGDEPRGRILKINDR
jgi:2-polyprenyl-6-methoxyphenol hydroxylase-like FAD-dependent oxidoreductase